MKLSAFRIRNYRSIVDSDITYLSNDNITTLIGQNESGKTTVLEALHSFSTGNINEDILRSDGSFPVVECYFEFDDKLLKDFLDFEKIPEGLRRKLAKKKNIWLERKWSSLPTSAFLCSDNDLVEFYEEKDEDDNNRVENIHREIRQINKETNQLRAEIQVFEKDRQDLLKETSEAEKQLNRIKKKLDRAKKPDIKEALDHEYEASNKIYVQKKIDFDEVLKILEEKKEKLEAYGEKDVLAERFLDIKRQYYKDKERFDTCNDELDGFETIYNSTSESKDQLILHDNIQRVRREQQFLHQSYYDSKNALNFIERVAEKVLNGKNTRIAESEVKIELSKRKATYTLEDIGNELYQHLPVFEFFEDFSSLLPNRIDLEELFTQNTQVEGYKAVENFLTIAGLSSEFFHQQNDRILKQKIENLNGEITINFHEFWSQKIGKQNKIHLNFELEHYNNTNSEKSGKPYLEFWIKDNYERLYPKQRSRGVRWFLSFYLELKATAVSQKQKILLIDEPGLSLHAKAQQDVLKVFENLKHELQIIYCTHSSHLIDLDKMHRILAVQREEGDDLTSHSIILDAKSLKDANDDTLLPVFSMISGQIVQGNHLIKEHNVIVEDISSYYFLNAFSKLLNTKLQIHYIPASGVTSIPVLANLLTAWRADFSVLLPGKPEAQKVFNELKSSIFIQDEQSAETKLIRMEKDAVVDMFSKFDFKKHILGKRAGIPESNSEYIEINNLSPNFLASDFAGKVDKGELTTSNFDEHTLAAIEDLLTQIHQSVFEGSNTKEAAFSN